MAELGLRSTLYCPFLLPVLSEGAWMGMGSAQVRCRLPAGEVRVIPAVVAQRLCSQGGYYDCPAYRFWRQPEQRLSGIA